MSLYPNELELQNMAGFLKKTKQTISPHDGIPIGSFCVEQFFQADESFCAPDQICWVKLSTSSRRHIDFCCRFIARLK